MKKLCLSIVFTLTFSLLSYSHSGRTDSYGGHHNRKTGEYHSHNSGNETGDSGKVIVLVLVGIYFICAIIYNLGDNDKKN